MMKRIIIFLITNTLSYGMQQPTPAAASPRTDEAALIHKLHLRIYGKDLDLLLRSMPSMRQRLAASRRTTFTGNNPNLKIVFFNGTAAIYGNDDEKPEYGFSLAVFQNMLQEIKKKVARSE